MLVDQAIEFLNEALRQDPESVMKMFSIAMPATQKAIDHPHIQVTMDHQLRLIGLLNGLIGDSQNRLAMQFDDETGELIGFCVLVEESREIC